MMMAMGSANRIDNRQSTRERRRLLVTSRRYFDASNRSCSKDDGYNA
jgi:hypothetical protein